MKPRLMFQSRHTLRFYNLNVESTLASMLNNANTLRGHLRGGHLLSQLPEQFQSEIALHSAWRQCNFIQSIRRRYAVRG